MNKLIFVLISLVIPKEDLKFKYVHEQEDGSLINLLKDKEYDVNRL